MRFATDTGGTFTDLVVEDERGEVRAYKSSTVPSDPVAGVLDVLWLAAEDRGLSLGQLLGRGASFIHGTTHAINAMITGRTAKTALITTRGHRDVLTMREGGRSGAFDHAIPYPAPYVPRALSFEVEERVDSAGAVLRALDEASVAEALEAIAEEGVEAVAVCLLWSISNPGHERRVGQLIRERLPGVPVTLSHRLNPVAREYRRASSACIDASLKPLMGAYLDGLASRLAEHGYAGPLLVLTSKGGMQSARAVARAPIQVLNSGPSMAPVAGRYFGASANPGEAVRNVIVTDAGGTTYDVSLVRDGRIPLTQDTWVGPRYRGDLTGFASVDVTSVGAGGGSLARVDDGGVLHVGPQSAGADPGPACYGRGGTRPTLTDAAVVLGYIDPDYFLGGRMRLDAGASRAAIERHVSRPLQLSPHAAAASVLALATEHMVQAIVEITIHQGVDPRRSVLVGGGGAAGLNAVAIARRLGCPRVIVPDLGATLSAAGAVMSDVVAEYRDSTFMTSDAFDANAANAVLDRLRRRCETFAEANRDIALGTAIQFGIEARYENQVSSIDLPMPSRRFDDGYGVTRLVNDFHRAHERRYRVADPDSAVEIVGWTATVRCSVREHERVRLAPGGGPVRATGRRTAHFTGAGRVQTPVVAAEQVPTGTWTRGPALIETPYTTVVVDPQADFRRTEAGGVLLRPQPPQR